VGDKARGNVKVFETQTGQLLSGQSTPFISLIKLESLRDMSRITGLKINPIRFRGNISFECSKPWSENDRVGRTL
jgi:uncharacterized protein YcbX